MRSGPHSFIPAWTCASAFIAALCVFLPPPPVVAQMKVPAASDWVDRGVIFSAGRPGAWDLYLWGGFAMSAVKKGGVFHLYYQGSSGYDDVEETVVGRSIGVATSTTGYDGFVKSASNPLITWHPSCPQNNCEEGAASAGAFVGANKEIHVYYGANTQVSSSAVNADGRLATSLDGVAFIDRGIALNHTNSSIWGFGDELFPTIGLQHGDTFVTYYLPNGTGTGRTLGAAWGQTATGLTQSARVTSNGTPVSAWGGGSAVHLGGTTYAVFVSVVTAARVDVYTVDLTAPHQFTGPVASYAFPEMLQGTVLFDPETSTWFLYYRAASGDAYGVKTFQLETPGPPPPPPPPGPGPEPTVDLPPGAPQNLQAIYNAGILTLTWLPPAAGGAGAPTSYVLSAGYLPSQSDIADFDTGLLATTFSVPVSSGFPPAHTSGGAMNPGGLMFIRVHARNAAGISGPSNEILMDTRNAACSGAPLVPGPLSVTVQGPQAAFSWGAAPGASSHIAEAGSAPGAANLVRINLGTQTSIAATAPAGTYYVRVRGQNACGVSPPSNEVVVVIQ
jgi:hypothetical protein